MDTTDLPCRRSVVSVRHLTLLHRWRLPFAYALRHHWLQILIIAVGLCFYIGLRLAAASHTTNLEAKHYPAAFTDWFDLFSDALNGLTFLVALFVWFGEVREDWEASLPKLLSVFFFYGQKPVFVCRHAWLSHEGDIRAMGQSIGQQMNNGRLDFVPFLQELPPQLVLDAAGAARKHFRVKFRLVEVPPVVRSMPADTKTVGTAFIWHGEAEDKATPIDPAQLLAQPDVAEWLPQTPQT